jgi:hypothetical protein
VNDVVKAVVAGEGHIAVVDVEATCWKKGVFSRKKETIEIGVFSRHDVPSIEKTVPCQRSTESPSAWSAVVFPPPGTSG